MNKGTFWNILTYQQNVVPMYFINFALYKKSQAKVDSEVKGYLSPLCTVSSVSIQYEIYSITLLFQIRT